jgi:hypothetical protein
MSNLLITMLVAFVILILQDLVGARPPGNMTTLAWWFNGALVGIAAGGLVNIWS